MATHRKNKTSTAAVRRQVCLRCCTILSRAFLHHLQALASLPGFGKLWLDTVALLSQNLEDVGVAGSAGNSREARGVGAGAGSIAAESCQQIVTNMVMVVAYAGLLGRQGVGDTGEKLLRGALGHSLAHEREGGEVGGDVSLLQDTGGLVYIFF